GLRREMEHAVDLGMLLQERRDRAALGEIELMEGEAWQRLQLGEPRFLERHGVIGVEIVDADHMLAAAQQRCRGVHADEAGSAGDEHGHGVPPRRFEMALLYPGRCGKSCVLCRRAAGWQGPASRLSSASRSMGGSS